MSDNRTPLGSGNFSDDEDLQLAHPSYAQGVYGRSGRSKPIILLVAAFIFIVLSSGLYYYAYQRGLEDGQNITPPIVAAEPGDMKVSAEDAGEVSEPAPDLNIYDVMDGTNSKIILSESRPADNNNGELESLMPSSEPKPESKPETKQETKQEPIKEQAKVEVGQPYTQGSGTADETNSATQVTESKKQTAPVATKPKAEPSSQTASPKLDLTVDNRFMVQLSASRSRALALASFEAAQKKNSSLLGRRSPLIFRVDLGSKGIFYRVNVGGFRSKTDAASFCRKLKAGGQDCLVKNEPS
jgi:hypothetical protein